MKKGLKYTMAAAAGAGAVMLLSKKTKENEHKQKEISKKREDERKDYRNTERGKYEKNSKGIYYSNGNYEAFARPEKPEGVDGKNRCRPSTGSHFACAPPRGRWYLSNYTADPGCRPLPGTRRESEQTAGADFAALQTGRCAG